MESTHGKGFFGAISSEVRGRKLIRTQVFIRMNLLQAALTLGPETFLKGQIGSRTSDTEGN